MVVVALGLALTPAGAAAQPGQPGYLTYRVMYLDTANTISFDVDVASGNLMVTERDIAREDRGREVEVDRTYNSQAAEPSAADATLGPGWTFDVGVQTQVAYAGGAATVYGPDGYSQQLVQAPDGDLRRSDRLPLGPQPRTDGSSILADAEEKLRFAASGELVGVSDKNGPCTVEDIEVGGQAVLGSFGASEKRRARFYYDGTFRVKRFRDSSGAWHCYTYEPMGDLTGIRQPDGSSMSYGYDRDGLPAQIASRPDGTVVSIAYSASGRCGPSPCTNLAKNR